MRSFVLTGGLIVTPEKIFEGEVVVKDGKIAEVRQGYSSAQEEAEVVDLKGKHLLPGLIDAHVHFRTPGMTRKEDWTTGSKAALAGGVTTVLDMPNTDPPTTDRVSLDLKRSLVQKEALVNYGFFAGATKDNLDELKAIQDIAGIKVYMGSSTGNLLVDDLQTLEALMKDSGKMLALHAENEECIRRGAEEHAGENDPAVHSRIRAPECAVQAVEAALEMVKKHKGKVHFCHASTRREIELIRGFKKEQPAEIARLISVEVTPHHLFLCDEDYGQYGNVAKVNPPLRSRDDVDALWEGIADGTVDMVATDHAPHLLEEKRLPYSQAPSGVPGVQTMLPLLLHAANEGKLTLQKIVELCSFHPAQRFGIKGKGGIVAGADADFTVVDMHLREKVCHKFLWTKPNWSPFHGWVLAGWPVMTYVNGELMYEWRERFGTRLAKEISYVA